MSHLRPQPAASRRAGLTVLELVSALALFVIVLGTLMVALNSATDIWSHNTSKARVRHSVRNALDLLATDLAGAVAQVPAAQIPAPAAGTESSGPADEPFFIAENKANEQISLCFVRQRSPLEIREDRAISLELVAYRWTTNGLSRHTQPVVSPQHDLIQPPVSEQLSKFANAVADLPPGSNVIAAAVVSFVPLVYQPGRTAQLASETQPLEPLNPAGERVVIADLPDFIDVHLACADRTAASAAAVTNYLTRRITLPAAQASRLP